MAPLWRASWRREETPSTPGDSAKKAPTADGGAPPASNSGNSAQVDTRGDHGHPEPVPGGGPAGSPAADPTPAAGPTPAPGAGGTPPTPGTPNPGTGSGPDPPGPKGPDNPNGNSPTLPTPANPSPSPSQPTPENTPSNPTSNTGNPTPQNGNTPASSPDPPTTGNNAPSTPQPQSQPNGGPRPKPSNNPSAVDNSQATPADNTGGTLVSSDAGTLAGEVNGQSAPASLGSPDAGLPAPTPVRDHRTDRAGPAPTPLTFTSTHTSTVVFSDAAGNAMSTSLSTFTSVETTYSTPQVQANASKGHGGAIAGGVIGALLFILIASFVGFAIIRRRRQRELDMDFLTVTNNQESPPMIQIPETYSAHRKPVPGSENSHGRAVSDASLLSIPSVSDDPFWAPLGAPKKKTNESNHGHSQGAAADYGDPFQGGSAADEDPFQGGTAAGEDPFADPAGPPPEIRVHAPPPPGSFQGVGTAYGVGGKGVSRLSDGSVGKKPQFGFAV